MRRLLVFGLLFAPALATAQTAFRVDAGLSWRSADEPYFEGGASALAPLGTGPYVVGAGVARAGKLFDVSYAVPYDLPEPDGGSEFYGVPDLIERWTAVTAFGGVRLESGRAAVQATAGPVLSIAEKGSGDVLVGGGVGAEVGLLDVYPVPAVGLGLSVHGATTTSHSWAGVRFGLRARL